MHRPAYSREILTEEFLKEATPLLVRHWDEVASHPDIPLDINVSGYLATEAAGLYRCYTARIGNLLVGYVGFLVSPSLHHRTSPSQALQDVVFLDPDHRLGMAAQGLLQFAEDALKEEGVQIVHHTVKMDHPVLGIILQRMKYQANEVIYSKRLDHG